MDYLENIRTFVRDIYQMFSAPTYAFEGMPSYFASTPEADLGDSRLVNALFSHHDSGGKHNKGTHHLYNSPHSVIIHRNGRSYTIDKREKPEGLTLTQWLCSQFRMGHKQASQTAKMFGK